MVSVFAASLRSPLTAGFCSHGRPQPPQWRATSVNFGNVLVGATSNPLTVNVRSIPATFSRSSGKHANGNGNAETFNVLSNGMPACLGLSGPTSCAFPCDVYPLGDRTVHSRSRSTGVHRSLAILGALSSPIDYTGKRVAAHGHAQRDAGVGRAGCNRGRGVGDTMPAGLTTSVPITLYDSTGAGDERERDAL